MQKLISVIIPIYNVEKYLARCLDSVVGQTYKNLEIICVNDCSPDNSIAIVNEYSKTDNRIKIINHEKNMGLSVARLSGLKAATGEYIYFIDSDDWVSPDFLEKMYSAIIENKQKAVCCTHVLRAYNDGTTKIFSNRDFEHGFVPYYMSSQMAPTWLLKKSFLDEFDTIFPLGLKYEDLYFFNVVIRSLEQVFVINTATYYYYENKDSIMGATENRTINNFDIIEEIKLIYEKYKSLDKLSEWSIPFFYMPKYMLNIHENKSEFFNKLRSLFLIMKDDVQKYNSLYSKLEIDFFNQILQYNDYESYSHLNTSVIGALRNKIKKNKG